MRVARVVIRGSVIMKVINIMTGRLDSVWCGRVRAQAERSTPEVSKQRTPGRGPHGGMERPANHVCVLHSHVNCHTCKYKM